MLARTKFFGYITGLLFAAQACVAQTPQTKEAFEAFTIGDYRAALKLCTEALDANPTDTAAIFYQGLCYLKVYLAATNDSSVSVLSDIGRVFQNISRFDSAAVYFAAAVRQDTSLASSHFNLGLAHYQLKKYREAERAMLRAITLSKTNLDFSSRQHYMLGATRMSQNKNKSAIQAYRQAIELNPDCYECYYFLGTVYQTLNDRQKAATWFRHFLQRTAGLKEVHFDGMRKYARQYLQQTNAVQK